MSPKELVEFFNWFDGTIIVESQGIVNNILWVRVIELQHIVQQPASMKMSTQFMSVLIRVC